MCRNHAKSAVLRDRNGTKCIPKKSEADKEDRGERKKTSVIIVVTPCTLEFLNEKEPKNVKIVKRTKFLRVRLCKYSQAYFTIN